MYNIRFSYFDGTTIDCKDITFVKNSSVNDTYTGELILTGYYPLGVSYWVKSDKESYAVSGQNLKSIFVTKI